MSLRGRVVALVTLTLLLSVSVYVAIASANARRDLQAELAAARTGGVQTVRSAFEDLPRSDHPQRDLRQLVATFNGNRHLVAQVVDGSRKVRLSSTASMPDRPAPFWFETSFRPAIEPVSIKVPNTSNQVLTLTPEPASDIAALWSAMADAALVFATAAGLGLALIYWVIGRALAPLLDLSRGLESIGASDDRQRLREAGPPEVHRLQRGFNAMAERLSEIDQRNRALEAQLLTIQDEERAEIAQDLHDEIGPHLFAVALDAQMIGQCASQGDTKAIPDQVRSIQAAVSYMQREVRDLIARLRPTRAAELGLEAAVGDLIDFWRGRQPDVDFVSKLDAADDLVPEALRDVIYRIVQESVANGLRHADTKQLSVSVLATAEAVTVTVANRGNAKVSVSETPGLGLASMRERVQAAGGALRIDRAEEGWTVEAEFAQPDKRAVA
jgi:two-component system sensor histidine kinase UhpB